MTAARTGRAFIVSALTAIAGVAVLSFSSLPLLRDFGRIVAMNVTVALLSALVVLPPMLVWADRRNLVSRGLLRKKVEPYADAPPVHYPAPDPRLRPVPEPARAGGRAVALGAEIGLTARREAVADSKAEREPEVLELAHVELERARSRGRTSPPDRAPAARGARRSRRGPRRSRARCGSPGRAARAGGRSSATSSGVERRRRSRARRAGPARRRGGTRSGTPGGRRALAGRRPARPASVRPHAARRPHGCGRETMSTASTSMMPAAVR